MPSEIPQFELSLLDARYVAWLHDTFDHPLTQPEWYWRADYTSSRRDHAVDITYCTQLFRAPSAATGRFERPLVVQGFRFINSIPGYLAHLGEARVPRSRQEDCLNAMFDLFLNLFAEDQLDNNCSMWFDYLWSWSSIRDDPETLRHLPPLLRRILTIDSPGCWKSALHGLNHVALALPHEVMAVVDEFLAAHRHLDEELRAYALACREGGVP